MQVERMCVSCKKRLSKEELIRISVNNGVPVIDNKKLQKSRAIYICKNDRCFQVLKKSNAVERFLRVEPTEDLYAEIQMLINKKGE